MPSDAAGAAISNAAGALALTAMLVKPSGFSEAKALISPPSDKPNIEGAAKNTVNRQVNIANRILSRAKESRADLLCKPWDEIVLIFATFNFSSYIGLPKTDNLFCFVEYDKARYLNEKMGIGATCLLAPRKCRISGTEK
jgi:hypothetical protein